MKKSSKKITKIANDRKLDLILREIIRIEKEMDIGFDGLRKDFRQLQGAVDGYAKKADSYFQEMMMLGRKVDRLEKWIIQIAGETGVRLKS
jgi:hypothetical protein